MGLFAGYGGAFRVIESIQIYSPCKNKHSWERGKLGISPAIIDNRLGDIIIKSSLSQASKSKHILPVVNWSALEIDHTTIGSQVERKGKGCACLGIRVGLPDEVVAGLVFEAFKGHISP